MATGHNRHFLLTWGQGGSESMFASWASERAVFLSERASWTEPTQGPVMAMLLPAVKHVGEHFIYIFAKLNSPIMSLALFRY